LSQPLIVRRPIAIENDRLLAGDAVRKDTVGLTTGLTHALGSPAWNSVVVRPAQRRALVECPICAPPPVEGYVVQSLFSQPSVTAFVAPPPETTGTHSELAVRCRAHATSCSRSTWSGRLPDSKDPALSYSLNRSGSRRQKGRNGRDTRRCTPPIRSLAEKRGGGRQRDNLGEMFAGAVSRAHFQALVVSQLSGLMLYPSIRLSCLCNLGPT